MQRCCGDLQASLTFVPHLVNKMAQRIGAANSLVFYMQNSAIVPANMQRSSIVEVSASAFASSLVTPWPAAKLGVFAYRNPAKFPSFEYRVFRAPRSVLHTLPVLLAPCSVGSAVQRALKTDRRRGYTSSGSAHFRFGKSCHR